MITQAELDKMSDSNLEAERQKLKSQCEGAEAQVKRDRPIKAAHELAMLKLESIQKDLSAIADEIVNRKLGLKTGAGH